MEAMNILKRNGSWEVIDLLRDKNNGVQVGLLLKCKVDGSIEKYKASLVAKNFTQIPIAKINSDHVLMSLLVSYTN